LTAAIATAGYDLAPQTPPMGNMLVLLLAVVALSFLSGMTYGPVAALLSEMFPPAMRYSSLSIPYHIGTGYFGGFLPFIASYMVARTGNPYAGLWYTLVVVAVALAVILWGEGRSWSKGLDGAGEAR
jgi:MFS family permease